MSDASGLTMLSQRSLSRVELVSGSWKRLLEGPGWGKLLGDQLQERVENVQAVFSSA